MFEWPLRVYIEDTDAGGIVYYANYLRYLERARTEWLRTLGLAQEKFRQDDILIVVRDVQLRYRAPAKLDDELIATVVIEKHRRTGLTLQQQVWRCDEASHRTLLLDGRIELACITSAGRPRALPAELIQALGNLPAS
ncbi:tol-pal system-associated acyl-CoA thioesterase [Venatoribacter cucullus]|uniref:tol-pal system-associated acyl-CoA thioesterase n=1 Tax=Venatoribacter cucullus TaxID=2661630 RepID=UPI00223FE17B|nr:tol-pal system-associated acyl-CoA thioesterase [Venatoribacter cucullus]UZK03316.1 tol-pal system-associated acyl-CoA thioesterase [Venatoribacter cucullus]